MRYSLQLFSYYNLMHLFVQNKFGLLNHTHYLFKIIYYITIYRFLVTMINVIKNLDIFQLCYLYIYLSLTYSVSQCISNICAFLAENRIKAHMLTYSFSQYIQLTYVLASFMQFDFWYIHIYLSCKLIFSFIRALLTVEFT